MESVPSVPAVDPSTGSLLERAYRGAIRQGDVADRTRTKLLDAAFDQFCRMGIQRSSMDEVARRAGLSRITIYRKFETKDALVEQVVIREFQRYFNQFRTDIRQARDVDERVVVGFVSSLRTIGRNPLIGGLIQAEPTLLIGSLVGDDGRMIATVREFVAGQLRKEQESGAISADLDVDMVAEMMVRISASFLTIPTHIIDLDDDAELASVARRFLVPMLHPTN